jgi:Icc-related predicted phosphoesterase
MKILLVSDIESPRIWDRFNPNEYKDVELIISCGDLKAEYLSFLVTMIKAPLFYVNGNHDIGYLKNPPEGCTPIDDKFVKYKGMRIVGLGGSKGTNPKAFEYTDDEMHKRVRKLMPQIRWNKGFDILVTHAAAYGINDQKDFCHEGFKVFNTLLDKYSPRYFFHGHIHLNYGRIPRIVQYKNTTAINAYERYILDYESDYKVQATN